MIDIRVRIEASLTEIEAREYLGYLQDDAERVDTAKIERELKKDLDRWVKRNIKNSP